MNRAESNGTDDALAGRGVVITRPRGQAARTAQLVEAAGGCAILFPALEIADVEASPALIGLIDRLERFDYATFISPTAVERAMDLVRARRAWPAGLRAAAIGRGTARALERCGVAPVLSPAERFDSEGLLALPELRVVHGKSVVIFRGEGGRELLGDALRARGARVEYAACYRRVRPTVDPQPLLDGWSRGAIHAILATSGEAVRNLFDMVGVSGRDRLRGTPLFVPHERIAAVAAALGIGCVTVTEPGDAGMVAGLIRFFAKQRIE